MKTYAVAVFFILATTLATGTAQAGGQPATINGYVIDSACTFVKNLKRPVSRECAIACAKAGSPLVILSSTGKIYWPISDKVPAAGQNRQLLPFADDRVVVTGTVYERGGSRAIVIQNVKAVHDAQ
jgi:hypothetical protein